MKGEMKGESVGEMFEMKNIITIEMNINPERAKERERERGREKEREIE